MSKYGVISGQYFPVFGLNTERYSVILRIQSEYRKIRTRNISVFEQFSLPDFQSKVTCKKSVITKLHFTVRFNPHCVNSVSFFWSLFSCIRTVYGNLRISVFSPNTEIIWNINSVFGHFSRSATFFGFLRAQILGYVCTSTSCMQ